MDALKRISQTGTVFLALCAVALAQEPGISWQTDLGQAREQAAQSGRLVLVHFWADWCKPCMRLEEEVFRYPQVASALEANYVPVKLHADQHADQARQFGVTSLPCDVILTPQGEVLVKANSPMTAGAYLKQMGEIATTYRAKGGPRLARNAALPSRPEESNPYAAGGAAGNPYAAQSGPRPSAYAPPTNTPPVAQPERPPVPSMSANPYAAGANRYAAAPPAGANAPRGQSNPYAQQPPAGDRYAMNAPAAASPPSRQANPYAAGPTDRYGAAPQTASAGTGAAPRYGAGPAANAPSENPYLAANPAGAATQEQNPYAMPNTPGQSAPAAGPAANPHPVYGGQPSPSAAREADAPRSPSVQPPPTSHQPPTTNHQAEFGLDGFCPVTLMESQKWTPGDRRWGAVHRGTTYIFAGEEEQRKFLADPDRYSPAMAGVDPVLALEQGQRVPGQRRHGVYYRDHIYLFSSEATLARFSQAPQHFAEGVRQAMRQPAPGDAQRR
jgi:YHS domain-containing protein/thiol-disulfide isomerase/thioredoxin